MNDLLDEALTETFPASDPIAIINIELESPGHGIAITPGFILRSEGRCDVDVVAATGGQGVGQNLEPTHEQSTVSRYDASHLWCQPVATHRLVCWPQPRSTPAIRDGAAAT